MAEEGVYPFVVYIRNAFIGHNLEVVKKPIEAKHEILPGKVLDLHLHSEDDYLEIKLKPENCESTYYIWCGPKALCRLDGGEPSVEPTVRTCDGKKPLQEGNSQNMYYRGGGWKSTDFKHPWTLTIKKRYHDPEEENVTIGEPPPGN